MKDDQDGTTSPNPSHAGLNRLVTAALVGVEYAIVVSVVVVAGIVLVRSLITFVGHWHTFPASVVGAVDGVLAVIIILDIAHTVFDHVRSWAFSVRPFLVIGILAGVRDVLSASARLALSRHLSSTDFKNILVALGVGVGVVLALLVGLVLLHHSGYREDSQ